MGLTCCLRASRAADRLSTFACRLLTFASSIATLPFNCPTSSTGGSLLGTNTVGGKGAHCGAGVAGGRTDCWLNH